MTVRTKKTRKRKKWKDGTTIRSKCVHCFFLFSEKSLMDTLTATATTATIIIIPFGLILFNRFAGHAARSGFLLLTVFSAGRCSTITCSIAYRFNFWVHFFSPRFFLFFLDSVLKQILMKCNHKSKWIINGWFLLNISGWISRCVTQT